MGSQGVSPKPDLPSNAAAVPQTSAKHPVAKNSGPHRVSRKTSPKSKSESKVEAWATLVESAIEALALVIEPGVAAVVHLVTRVIPESPTKGLPFVAVLAVLTFILGNKPDAKHDQLCFGCLGLLGVVAVCLVIIAVKNPGTDVRLSEMQAERASAIKVKPLQY